MSKTINQFKKNNMQSSLKRETHKSNKKFEISLNDSEFLIENENEVKSNLKNDVANSSIQNSNKTNTDKNISRTSRTESISKVSESFVSNSQKLLYLSAWELPESILERYRNRGLTKMFQWQAECLSNPKVLFENKNLVYSAPTSAGKTLVAEILALKTVLERKKKVVIILPFVSVVREKMYYFQDILSTNGIRVAGFMGSHNPPGGFKMVNLAICTIEKANGIVNRLLEENMLGEIGAVIIDEMHLLGDPHRGYLLELLLTKLKYMSLKNENDKIQLIGMSATLPNLNFLATWLEAELFTTDFRPIPLKEFSMFNGEIYNTDLKLERRLKSLPDLKEDTDFLLQICLETISDSCSVLIFCPTKHWCENLAQQIAVAFWKLGRTQTPLGQCLRTQLSVKLITETLEQLQRSPVGLDSILKKTISFAVAFHHAGLTMDERDIIEGAFRSGAIRILIATSTLSSGVNLPARRVIIRTPMFHGRSIDTLTYRQMIGRAGRMGKDTAGESILICQKNDKQIASDLMSAKLEPIESCLEGAGKLKRAILEVIASGVASTIEDVNLFTKCTLLASNQEHFENDPIAKAIDFLKENEFIRLQVGDILWQNLGILALILEMGLQTNDKEELIYAPTSLAKACLSSSLPPEDGLDLFEELEKARRCLCLDTELHLLYLVTPYSVCNQWTTLDWMSFLNMWEKLPASNKRVADLVGVKESFIFNATRGKLTTNTSKMFHKLQIHRRFYTALALQDLVNEVSLNDVANKFQCSRGMLQSLQQSASTFAGMVTAFSKQLGWTCLEILISQFQDRLQFGIHHELLELMKLPLLNGPRARTLYNADIKTLVDLATTDICKLENILYSAVPFQSEKGREGETAHDVQEKKNLRSFFITGQKGLTANEAAKMLINDARRYLEDEMGAEVNWDQPLNTSTTSYDSYTSYDTCSSSSNDLPGFPNSKSITSNKIAQKYKKLMKKKSDPSKSSHKKISTIINTSASSIDEKNSFKQVQSTSKSKKILVKNSQKVVKGSTKAVKRDSYVINEKTNSLKSGPSKNSNKKQSSLKIKNSPNVVKIGSCIVDEQTNGPESPTKNCNIIQSSLKVKNSLHLVKSSPKVIKDIKVQPNSSMRNPNNIYNLMQHICEVKNDTNVVKNSQKAVKVASNLIESQSNSPKCNSNRIINSKETDSEFINSLNVVKNSPNLVKNTLSVVDREENSIKDDPSKNNQHGWEIKNGPNLVKSSPKNNAKKYSNSPSVNASKKQISVVKNALNFDSETNLLVVKNSPKSLSCFFNDTLNNKLQELSLNIESPLSQKSPEKLDSETIFCSHTLSEQFQNDLNFESSKMVNPKVQEVLQSSSDDIFKTEFEPEIKKETVFESKNSTFSEKDLFENEPLMESKISFQTKVGDFFQNETTFERKVVYESKSSQNDIFESSPYEVQSLEKNVDFEKNGGFDKSVDFDKTLDFDNSFGVQKFEDLSQKDIFENSQNDLDFFENQSDFQTKFDFSTQLDPKKLDIHEQDFLRRDQENNVSLKLKFEENNFSKRYFQEMDFQGSGLGVQENNVSKKLDLQEKKSNFPNKLKFQEKKFLTKLDFEAEISPKLDFQEKDCPKLDFLEKDCSKLDFHEKDSPNNLNFQEKDFLTKLNFEAEISSRDFQEKLLAKKLDFQDTDFLTKLDFETEISSKKLSFQETDSPKNENISKKIDSKKIDSKNSNLNSIVSNKESEDMFEIFENGSQNQDVCVETSNYDLIKCNWSSFNHDINNSDNTICQNDSCDSLFEDSFDTKSNLENDLNNSNLEKNIQNFDNGMSKFESAKKRKHSNSVENFQKRPKRESHKREIVISDVTSDKSLFANFSKTLLCTPHISMSLAAENFSPEKQTIGQKLMNRFHWKDPNFSKSNFVYENLQITGISMFWGKEIYYLNLRANQIVSTDEKVKLLKSVFENTKVTVRVFDSKKQLKILHKVLGITMECVIFDPKIADWLLEPEDGEKSIVSLVINYTPKNECIIRNVPDCPRTGSLGLYTGNSSPSFTRSGLEAYLIWYVTNSQAELFDEKLANTFRVEMNTIKCLVAIELNGLGVDREKLIDQLDKVKENIQLIEKQAYKLAGRKFAFHSSKDVSKVLGLTAKKQSTNKQALGQLNNPLSDLIITWRKLYHTSAKILAPILHVVKKNRIYGVCISRTSTGRISMQEPNLQCIPRNFEITIDDNTIPISIRSCFVPTNGKTFISADYCQLELRILAYLAEDPILCKILRSNGDIFKKIGSKLYNINEIDVDDTLRQHVKQICYGIIYGMGSKSLSEQLGTTENEAQEFIIKFMQRYPKIKIFMDKVISLCRMHGYVETIGGRRRYLPHISDEAGSLKAQAERQAINTTIQGSAADLSKTAMVDVQKAIIDNFGTSSFKLVLHLHDEFLYEVDNKYYLDAAQLIKDTMENAIKLPLPFPVTVKTGKSWGELTVMKLN